jgi:hypothetical protein
VNVGMIACCTLRALVEVENIHFLDSERDAGPSEVATYYISILGDFNEKEEKQPENIPQKVFN